MALEKLHATGNDFLVRTALDDPSLLAGEDVAALCDRHRGVGADGLLTLLPSERADCAMVLHNADGGRAEMSGNGVRCLAHVAVAAGLGSDDHLEVETDVGVRNVAVGRNAAGEVVDASVEMGSVSFEPDDLPLASDSAFDLTATFHGVEYRGDAASMGNPHWVLLVDDPEAVRLGSLGPRLATDERFPRGTNVGFVAVDSSRRLRLRVWERGVGETLSCGTGACAAAAVVHRRGLVGSSVEVEVRGGLLRVDVGGTITLGGGVSHCFGVDVDVDRLRRSGAGT